MPALKDGKERMDALATSDQKLTEEQVRMNERLARMDTKIDAIGVDTKRLIPFMEGQDKVNKDLQDANVKLLASNDKAEGALGIILSAFGLDDGDGSKSAFRKDMSFLRSHREGSEERDKTIRNALYGTVAVAVLFLLACGGTWYVRTGQTPTGTTVETIR